MLQIAPSKTDTERLLLVSPELADVLSAVVSRLPAENGAIPLVAAYDVRERVWNPPMPLLFQRSVGSERRAITPTALRKLLLNALAVTGLTDAAGDLLLFSPHDFRRIFVTDAIMSGLPPHIAQIICGHATIATTLGYKAIYPAEAIEAHRAFLARRRSTRPGEEYRIPTEEEWDAFLAHFEKRKVPSGPARGPTERPAFTSTPASDARSYGRSGTEARLEEIRDNLYARIAEAEQKAGSARSKASKSASPAPRTSSPRSMPPSFAEPPPPRSACHVHRCRRPHRSNLLTHRFANTGTETKFR